MKRASNFKTAAGKAKYKAAYDAVLTLWPVPYKSLEVNTNLGSTHTHLLLGLHAIASHTMHFPIVRQSLRHWLENTILRKDVL